MDIRAAITLVESSARLALAEGLIAVPPQVLKTAEGFALTQILWRLRDIAKTAYRGETLAAKVAASAEKLGIALPEQPCPEDNVVQRVIAFDTSDLPGHYPRKLQGNITIALEWGGSYEQSSGQRASAGYDSELNKVIVFLDRPDNILANDVIPLVAKVRNDLRHELRHAVQKNVLHADQQKSKAGYETSISDYFTSPLEFDTQIGSDLDRFMEYYAEKMPADLGNAVRTFVGMPAVRKPAAAGAAPGGLRLSPIISMGRSLEQSNFFYYLKRNNPERYKVAVRKFVAELGRRLKATSK